MTFILHAAGWLNKGEDSLERFRRHVRDAAMLLRGSGTHFLGTPEFQVRSFAVVGQLLVLENVHGGIDGCVAYDLVDLPTLDRTTGEVVQRRFNILRLLALRPMPYRHEIARHMVYEAMLRGTVCSLCGNDDLPHAAGTLGMVTEANERGMRWAAGLGDDVDLVRPEHVRPFDPTVAGLIEMTERMRVDHGRGEPYRLVLAKRTSLEEAAALHRIGGRGLRVGAEGPFIIYDPADKHRRAIDVAAQNIVNRNPTTLRKLGMIGRRSATAWGGPYAAGMGIALGRFSTGQM